MAFCRRYVIKLGGSVITYKDRPYSINYNNINISIKSISVAKKRGYDIVVVHGGGSFGHYEVSRLKKEKGVLTTADAAIIQYSMLRLANTILSSLLNNGVPATLHPPHTYCSNDMCNIDTIIRDVKHGLTPITYGDAIPDEHGVRILSGDDLMVIIARNIPESCALFVMSEEGVIGPNGNIIRTLSLPLPKEIIREASGIDVTGGLLKKLSSAFELAKAGVGTFITGIKGMRAILIDGVDPEEVSTTVIWSGE